MAMKRRDSTRFNKIINEDAMENYFKGFCAGNLGYKDIEDIGTVANYILTNRFFLPTVCLYKP